MEFHELISLLVASLTEQDLLDNVTAIIDKMGFEYFAYGLRISINVTRPKFILINNYSDEWRQRYTSQEYIDKDPTVMRGLTSNKPFIWSDLSRDKSIEFWDDAAAHGLKEGYTKSSILGPNAVGMMSLVRSHKSLSEKELLDKSANIALLDQTLQILVQDCFLSNLTSHNLVFTLREKEILKWSAEGKTSSDIAPILNITVRTVNFHMANIIEKFNVPNKTAAVLRAFQLGII